MNLFFSILVGYAASRKGRSGIGFFFLSFFVSFLIAAIIVAILQPTDEVKSKVVLAGTGKVISSVQCPFCKEQIRADANVCKHCGRDVEPAIDAIRALHEEEQAQAMAALAAAREAHLEREKLRSERVDRLTAPLKTRKAKIVVFSSVGVIALLVLAIAIPSGIAAKNAAEAQQALDDQRYAARLTELQNWNSIVSKCPTDSYASGRVSESNDKVTVNFKTDGKTTTSGYHDRAIYTFLSCVSSNILTPMQTDSKDFWPNLWTMADTCAFDGKPVTSNKNGIDITVSCQAKGWYGPFQLTISKNSGYDAALQQLYPKSPSNTTK